MSTETDRNVQVVRNSYNSCSTLCNFNLPWKASLLRFHGIFTQKTLAFTRRPTNFRNSVNRIRSARPSESSRFQIATTCLTYSHAVSPFPAYARGRIDDAGFPRNRYRPDLAWRAIFLNARPLARFVLIRDEDVRAVLLTPPLVLTTLAVHATT
ncbi:hypothetical protein CA13_06610 [Planctomycetes bacterium CA13]|uniref:Uncharacterized protein n=1 Tax=Novipirellula herctigrandis TaxID=2527986 RepID=A0A5C5YXJ2_9BACT|nr:hypothetical protein CA13_06610 [Planctomycetes bacterium CA13]